MAGRGYAHRERTGARQGSVWFAIAALIWIVALIAALVLVPLYLFRTTDPGPVRPIDREVTGVVGTATPDPIEPTSTLDGSPTEDADDPAPPVAPSPDTPAPTPRPPATARAAAGSVVVIDAGHQAQGDADHEPIGPGASETKMKVTWGTSGRTTGVAEHVVNLQVAKLLERELEARGVEVVMVRDSADVNISNSQRARIGNDADADLVIRLHCDGSEDTSIRGILTLVPSENRWTGPIVAPSARAGDRVHAAVLTETGAADRGIRAVGNMTGFNWSTVPTVIVEMGLMTNPEDDRLLTSPAYQEKLARGMANGAVAFLADR